MCGETALEIDFEEGDENWVVLNPRTKVFPVLRNIAAIGKATHTRPAGFSAIWPGHLILPPIVLS